MMHWCVGDVVDNTHLHYISISLPMMGFAIRKFMSNKIHGKEIQPKRTNVRITIAKICKFSQTPLAPQKLINKA
jgi:hypothetical protein